MVARRCWDIEEPRLVTEVGMMTIAAADLEWRRHPAASVDGPRSLIRGRKPREKNSPGFHRPMPPSKPQRAGRSWGLERTYHDGKGVK